MRLHIVIISVDRCGISLHDFLCTNARAAAVVRARHLFLFFSYSVLLLNARMCEHFASIAVPI